MSAILLLLLCCSFGILAQDCMQRYNDLIKEANKLASKKVPDYQKALNAYKRKSKAYLQATKAYPEFLKTWFLLELQHQ